MACRWRWSRLCASTVAVTPYEVSLITMTSALCFGIAKVKFNERGTNLTSDQMTPVRKPSDLRKPGAFHPNHDRPGSDRLAATLVVTLRGGTPRPTGRGHAEGSTPRMRWSS
jgi:hypothetical protein